MIFQYFTQYGDSYFWECIITGEGYFNCRKGVGNIVLLSMKTPVYYKPVILFSRDNWHWLIKRVLAAVFHPPRCYFTYCLVRAFASTVYNNFYNRTNWTNSKYFVSMLTTTSGNAFNFFLRENFFQIYTCCNLFLENPIDFLPCSLCSVAILRWTSHVAVMILRLILNRRLIWQIVFFNLELLLFKQKQIF